MGTLNRLATTAVGLGIGTALAATAGVAFADTLSSDGGAGALAAADIGDVTALVGTAAAITPPTVPDDFASFAISISGIPLFQTGTAFAYSSFGNIAIAHGDLTEAKAFSGLFNFASVDGDGSVAVAGSDASGWFNSATVVGEYSMAEAAYGLRGSGNVASVTGDHSGAYAGTPFFGPGSTSSGDFNTATVEGTGAKAWAGWDGSSNNVADASGDDTVVWSPAGPPVPPASAVLEPGAAITANDLFGDGVATTASGGDFWTELANLF